ncbi:MAG: ATP-dependent RNA helicase HrpA [Phycisphaerales bacterium]
MPVSAAGPDSTHSLTQLLEQCMVIDRFRLGRRVRELAREPRPTESQREQIRHLVSILTRSIERREQRRSAAPTPSFDPTLPIVQARDRIAEAISNNQVVVVCGATGSGKTTQLPKICLEVGRGLTGIIGHTQPRRIAARSVAARIAEELGTRLGGGGVVGYKVRFTDQVSRSSLIKLMTDGILLAETQSDRLLAQYDTLIIDEAHERSLNIDFLLGYIRQLLPSRPDLKVIVTSATIDPQSFADHFADSSGKPAPIIEVSGRTYPVEVRYRPLRRVDDDTREIEMEHAVVQAAAELIGAGKAEPGGEGRDRDILVFLPGEREIRETADELAQSHALRGCEVIPLYARLSTDEQNRVFAPHDGRRIVLATNVAETSLTVPGVKYVIDSGLARISRYSPRIKVQRLPIEPISQASAQQRSGRCGRTSPGIAIRLYSEEDFAGRPAFTDPEILRTNLASVILQMKALGLTGTDGRVGSFPFMQPPNPGAVKDGYDTLVELGAIDAAGNLTDAGRKLARLPVDPRIARMVLAAADERCVAEVLVIAAALSVQDPRERPSDRQQEADALHEKWQDPEKSSDFIAFLNLWRGFAEQERKLSGNQLRRWCRSNLLSYVRLREWQDIQRQLAELAGEIGIRTEPTRQNRYPAQLYEQVHRALLAGLLSNIGVKSAEKGAGAGLGEYEGARGIRFAVFPGSALFREKPKWVMAAELVRTTRLYARTVARVQPAWIEKSAAHLVTRTYDEPHWSADTAQVAAFETVTLFGLPIIKRRRTHYGPIQPEQSRAIFIEHALVKGEYLSAGKFQRANHATQQSIQRLEEKKRRHDLLADPSARFGFFHERVPADVYDGPGFERWRQRAEARQPEVLIIPRERMLAPGAVEPPPDLFPDALTVRAGGAEVRIGLSYRHKHNDPEDGVTAIIPLPALASINTARFDWLVPGFAREKIVELIRALPKPMRVNLAPATGFAEKAVAMLAPRFGEGDFLSAVAEALTQLSPVGVTVSRDLLAQAERSAALPVHLRMNFRIVEQLPGRPVRTVASGRDLAQIKREMARQADSSLSGLPEGPCNRGGITCWDFGPRLPESAELDLSGSGAAGAPGGVRVFVALTDETSARTDKGRLTVHTAVGVRPFNDAARAAAAHRAGVVRLLAIDVASEARSLIDTIPQIEHVLVQGAPLARAEDLRANLAELAALESFAQLDPALLDAVRDKPAFDRALDAGWDRLGATGRAVVELAASIFWAHHALALVLDSAPSHWAAPIADVRHQLQALFLPACGRWLAETPYRWLRHFPRYLAGARIRLERLPTRFEGRDGGTRRTSEDLLARDAERLAGLLPLWSACIARLQHTGGLKGRWDSSPAAEYRWLIEELRIALFAQDLRAADPRAGSVKRMRELWGEVTGGK